MVWLQFAVCAAVIMWAGAKLSKYGDIIAELTGLTRSWVGVVLVASVTSLPELITGLSSVLVHNLPEIAAGDVLGSCMFNICIIAVLDFLSRDKPILSFGGDAHIISGGIGITLLGIVGVSLLAGDSMPVIGWFGLHSPVILLVYLVGMRVLFLFQKRRAKAQAKEYEDPTNISKTRAFTKYGISALIVVAAASWLPTLGERIAKMTGLEQSFVGTLFIALSTSLPEFVITYTAIRRGAIDLALGNLFGSNLFNVAILALEDLVYREAALFTVISPIHAVTANAAITMTAIAVAALAYRDGKKHFGFSWSSVVLVLVFAVGTALSYVLGGKGS